MLVLWFSASPTHETLQACVLPAPSILCNTEMLSPDCNAQFPVCDTSEILGVVCEMTCIRPFSVLQMNEVFQVRSRRKSNYLIGKMTFNYDARV